MELFTTSCHNNTSRTSRKLRLRWYWTVFALSTARGFTLSSGNANCYFVFLSHSHSSVLLSFFSLSCSGKQKLIVLSCRRLFRVLFYLVSLSHSHSSVLLSFFSLSSSEKQKLIVLSCRRLFRVLFYLARLLALLVFATSPIKMGVLKLTLSERCN